MSRAPRRIVPNPVISRAHQIHADERDVTRPRAMVHPPPLLELLCPPIVGGE
jgi:hypothetical protein